MTSFLYAAAARLRLVVVLLCLLVLPGEAVQWEWCSSSGRGKAKVKKLSVSMIPDPPRAGETVVFQLSGVTRVSLEQPVAKVKGVYMALGGLLPVPVSYTLDYCKGDERVEERGSERRSRQFSGAEFNPVEYFLQRPRSSRVRRKCPVRAGKFEIEFQYKVPPVLFSGELALNVRVDDEEHGELLCLDVETRVRGTLY